MSVNQAHFNREASKVYRQLSLHEREDLKNEACKEVQLRRREVLQ